MKNQAVYLTKPETMELRDAPMPQVGPDDVLVEVKATGICGSDVHFYQHGRIGDFIVEYPYILGHESGGVVVEAGGNVTHLKPGDLVAMEPGIPCGACPQCLEGRYNLCPDVVFFATPPYHGTLQRYVSHPARWTFPLPAGMTAQEGALMEPLSVGMHAASLGKVKAGDTVVVNGAGCIGLTCLLGARAFGAATVIVADLIDNRLEMAEANGGVAVNLKHRDLVQVVMDLTGGRGADVVLEASGAAAAQKQLPYLLKPAGTGVLVGLGGDEITMNASQIINKELNITGLFRYRNLYPTCISCTSAGTIDVKPLITHRYRFEEAPAAFADVVKHKESVAKAVILYD